MLVCSINQTKKQTNKQTNQKNIFNRHQTQYRYKNIIHFKKKKNSLSIEVKVKYYSY